MFKHDNQIVQAVVIKTSKMFPEFKGSKSAKFQLKQHNQANMKHKQTSQVRNSKIVPPISKNSMLDLLKS